jgi:hypothetical protein
VVNYWKGYWNIFYFIFLLIIFTLVASGFEKNNNYSKDFKNIYLPLLYYALNAVVVYFIWFYR